jgi:hypothetical protein
MPTLIAALTLAGLLKIAHLGVPHWHLAFWFAALVFVALLQMIPWPQAALNGVGSFLAAWLYFWLLDRTDNVTDRAAHWLVLITGLVILIGSRLWIDVKVYQVGL